MGRRSSIDQLPEEIRTAANDAVKRGATIDQIVDLLRDMGASVSRTAAGRFSQKYAALAARQREMLDIAKTYAAEFGETDTDQGRLMIQLLHTIITRAVMPIAAGDKIELDEKALANLARAVKDAMTAAKTDVDRVVKIREQAAKETREKAAAAAQKVARAAGATPETLKSIWEEIMGVTLAPAGAVA